MYSFGQMTFERPIKLPSRNVKEGVRYRGLESMGVIQAGATNLGIISI